MALLFRPRAASREASPAALRIELAPTLAGALMLDIVKRRGSAAAAPLRIDPRRPLAPPSPPHGPLAPAAVPPIFHPLAHVLARLPVDAHAAVDRHRLTALSTRRVPAGESIN